MLCIIDVYVWYSCCKSLYSHADSEWKDIFSELNPQNLDKSTNTSSGKHLFSHLFMRRYQKTSVLINAANKNAVKFYWKSNGVAPSLSRINISDVWI
jgi:hypothetical protein